MEILIVGLLVVILACLFNVERVLRRLEGRQNRDSLDELAISSEMETTEVELPVHAFSSGSKLLFIQKDGVPVSFEQAKSTMEALTAALENKETRIIVLPPWLSLTGIVTGDESLGTNP